jgi:N6-adenosine-specific RNA methylase IME4
MLQLGDFPEGHFGAIYADPPWKFQTYNDKGRKRSPDWKPFKGSPSVHYDSMEIHELCALPVSRVSAPNACLFMWVSWPMLEDALFLMKAWGFIYKTCGFAWLKADPFCLLADDRTVSMGMGYWTRANSEVCLLGTRGKPKRLKADVRQGIIAPRREHSRKPDEIYGRIERLVAGPYLELFSRTDRAGWTCWGNQTGKFPAVAA